MADIRPFRAFRPAPALAERVASPPYDVLDSDEARERAAGNPHSFLHVVKPEIDLPVDTNIYDASVYAKGAENLRALIDAGTLVQDEVPCFYVYQQIMGDHTQVGIVGGASVSEYDAGLIKKHENTRPSKEDDRTRHIDALNANTGPVFLTYRRVAGIDELVDEVRAGAPVYDFIADDEIRHTLWVVDEPRQVEGIRSLFGAIGELYVADGHHRSAAASRVAAARGGSGEHEHFLAVLFPDNQMKILDYNRVVSDLAGLDPAAFLERVSEAFEIVLENPGRAPTEPRTFGMYLGDRWYLLRAKPGTFDAADPVEGLDVSILQSNLLAPILGIDDPRTSDRIDFVGGIRGMDELEQRVAEGAAVAFAMYPTSMDELISIADAGKIMPPKSTWFEPKLRSGLIVRPL